MTTNERPCGWRTAVIATLLSAFVSLGFSIASLLSPSMIVSGADPAHVGPFAGYALSRSVAIAVAALVAVTRRTMHPLVAVGWIAGGVQALDVLVGLAQGDIAKSAGPAALAAFSAYAMTRLGRATSGQSLD